MPSIIDRTSTGGDLLLPEEVAALLRIQVGTLYTWRHRREGPPVIKVGGALRYPRGELEAWLAQRARAAS